ncbi:hypothetical protein KL933_003475 [Ogataea haglerorum]|uniref:AB hydrolase-1 domain-containing protein n=1 Tax=Ogataea haglerorum TaxID=1937702 RepID=A0AAN6D474_9ASCO|nr:uncharacterized protein KL911_003650 [Ogataea haglerorum]KAG7698471.1 hypothetical protein KL951_001735 [Ogataea haglerorum]KAG7706251.1 hypothetical protein KL914_003146 [Ogataea haglerorum]KAG7708036.1 hypothetical protein KL950_002662 [Ogataea haglerorum]KAG7717166.1 hypothetical protein KL913_002917 [Ogataea haglerorum]KAG7719446.1 hypothetical protein KL949_002438 [Ogataea haglerorum]
MKRFSNRMVQTIAQAYQTVSSARKPMASTDMGSMNTTSSSNLHYRTSTAPAGVPLSKILSNTFPLSVSESFKHYLKRHQLNKIQHDLLSVLPFYPTPSATHSAEVIQTVIDEQNNYINEFHISPIGKPSRKHVVFVHGYGAGLGFFVKNLQDLASRKTDWDIHAIDLLGYGCSSRPKFPYHEPNANYKKIEAWFTESLKKWFDRRNLNRDNTIVVAHSMGAYISALTNFKYPELFNKLLLVSPAGIYSTRQPEIPPWFDKLWNRNVSPFALVRNAGPFGSYLTSGWTARRFSKDSSILNAEEQKLMHMYTYAIFNARGSGEYMLNYMLAPGGIPRNPLLRRIHNLNCDSVWYYGSHDWMDKMGGVSACKTLRAKGLRADMKIVEDSGHHIYLDNLAAFNALVADELK